MFLGQYIKAEQEHIKNEILHFKSLKVILNRRSKIDNYVMENEEILLQHKNLCVERLIKLYFTHHLPECSYKDQYFIFFFLHFDSFGGYFFLISIEFKFQFN